MKKVLLTGALGSVGFATLKLLVQKEDVELTILELPTKKNKKRVKPYLNKINVVFGNLTDKKLVANIVQKMDFVIHLGAVIPPLADFNPELTRQVNYFGTKNIVDTIRTKNKDCFLVFASSVSVYGDRISNPWISVQDKLNPSIGDYYASVKIETEQMIRETNINYTIFRLTGIMGRPEIDPLMFHMPLDTKIEIATVEDTALAFTNAIYHQEQLNHKIFNLGGGEKCRTLYKDFLSNMFKYYGLNIKCLKDIAFAEKNFHCGYYKDSDDLEKILSFQNDTLDTYYSRIDKNTKGITRFFSKMLSRPIIYFLVKKSEPLQAKKKNNLNLIERFFNKK